MRYKYTYSNLGQVSIQSTTRRRTDLHQPLVFCIHPKITDVAMLDPNTQPGMEMFLRVSNTETKEKCDHLRASSVEKSFCISLNKPYVSLFGLDTSPWTVRLITLRGRNEQKVFLLFLTSQ